MRVRRFVRMFRWVHRGRRSAGEMEPAAPALLQASPVGAASICTGGIANTDLAALQLLGHRFLADARRSVRDNRAAEQWAARWLALVLWLRAARGDDRALRILHCASTSDGLAVAPDVAIRLLAELLEQELLRRQR